MKYPAFAGLALWCCCSVVHAQASADLHPPVPRLPGEATTGHFRFEADPAARAPSWASNLGQSVVRAVAIKHKMTSGPLVQYDSPDRQCGFEPDDPSCP